MPEARLLAGFEAAGDDRTTAPRGAREMAASSRAVARLVPVEPIATTGVSASAVSSRRTCWSMSAICRAAGSTRLASARIAGHCVVAIDRKSVVMRQ